MLIKLSDRMKAVASMAEGDTVADIGCDHGFVSIYLIQQGIAKNVVAMDLRKGPLAGAREHVAQYCLSDKIDIRLSDGFEKLHENEADCAVIAGMGGLLMIDILKKGKIHTDNGIKLVLQPQSDYDSVRAYLQMINYIIVDEVMLIDEGKTYFVIKALPMNDENMFKTYETEELFYGPCLLKKRDDVLKNYLEIEKQKKIELIKSLNNIKTQKAEERCVLLQNELTVIEKALQRF